MSKGKVEGKESFINEMIKDAKEHTEGFRVEMISNGKYTFGELIVYLKLAKKYEEFKVWLSIQKNVDMRGLTFDKIYIDEASDDDLPFAEKDFFKKKKTKGIP